MGLKVYIGNTYLCTKYTKLSTELSRAVIVFVAMRSMKRFHSLSKESKSAEEDRRTGWQMWCVLVGRLWGQTSWFWQSSHYLITAYTYTLFCLSSGVICILSRGSCNPPTSTPTDSSSLLIFQVFNCSSSMDALSFTTLTIGDSSSLLVTSWIDDGEFSTHLISV